MMFSRVKSKQEEKQSDPADAESASTPVEDLSAVEDVDNEKRYSERYTSMKVQLHQRLLDRMNLSAIDKMPPEQFKREVGEMVRELLVEENTPLNLNEQTLLVNDILDEVLGLGPLEPYLKDPSVTDILVNTSELIFVERGGRLANDAGPL